MATVGNLDDFRKRVKRRLGRIESEKLVPPTEDLDDLIDEALSQYDQHRPLQLVHEQAGDDTTRRLVLDQVIASWKNGTSRVLAVEAVTSPGSDDESSIRLDIDEWVVRPDPNRKDLLMLADVIGANRTLRIVWGDPHVIGKTDPAATTVPDGDTEALTLLAVGAAARWVSRSASDLKHSRLSEGVEIDFDGIARRWADRAREVEKKATALLTLPEHSARGAGGSVDWEPESTLARQPRVGH